MMFDKTIDQVIDDTFSKLWDLRWLFFFTAIIIYIMFGRLEGAKTPFITFERVREPIFPITIRIVNSSERTEVTNNEANIFYATSIVR